MHYYAFVIVSLTWLAYFLSHDYLSYINSLGFLIYFLFFSDEWPTVETLDFTIRIGSTQTFSYFDLYLYSAYAAHYVYIRILSLISILFKRSPSHSGVWFYVLYGGPWLLTLFAFCWWSTRISSRTCLCTGGTQHISLTSGRCHFIFMNGYNSSTHDTSTMP